MVRPVVATLLMIVCMPTAWAVRRSGALIVSATVNGATVEIDGKVVGKTPLKPVAVSAGTHRVKVRRLGYLDFADAVLVNAGKTTEVLANLLPFAGVLRVTANVPAAQVFVDGKLLGKAPLEQELKLGRHTIAVSARGHAAHTQVVQAEAGNTYEISARLTKESAASGASLELALEPLRHNTRPPPDDLLALEPLVDAGSARSVAAGKPVALALAPPPPAAETTAQAAETSQSWYQSPWAWGSAAAAVASGVVVAVLVARSGGQKRCNIDLGVTFGEQAFDPCAGQ